MLFPHVQPLIHTHGYWVVFLVVMLESAGIPLPGETALIAAAIYAGATDELDIALIIPLAASAAIIGDNLGFWFGKRFGFPFLLRYGHLLHMSTDRMKIGQYMFHRHGAKVVFFGRFVAVLRIFAALLAGVNHYPWRSFLFYNAAGGIVWAAVFGFGAYLFGDIVHRLAGPVAVTAGVIAAIGFLAMMKVMKRQEARWLGEAERALPGPLKAPGSRANV